jgi:hypothetical protein
MSETSLNELKNLILDLNEKVDNLNKHIENIEKSSENMDKHISFVDSVYETIWMPLNFITSNLTLLISGSEETKQLPVPEKLVRVSLMTNEIKKDNNKSVDEELDDIS